MCHNKHIISTMLKISNSETAKVCSKIQVSSVQFYFPRARAPSQAFCNNFLKILSNMFSTQHILHDPSRFWALFFCTICMIFLNNWFDSQLYDGNNFFVGVQSKHFSFGFTPSAISGYLINSRTRRFLPSLQHNNWCSPNFS